ncbi:hypothetical protein [Lonepinella sp. BR2357]|uniref:hypothetical protein n=1 Tax=Lonepinella sp. BR2357 TaxID=3434549 RepID=UPI003F6DAD81
MLFSYFVKSVVGVLTLLGLFHGIKSIRNYDKYDIFSNKNSDEKCSPHSQDIDKEETIELDKSEAIFRVALTELGRYKISIIENDINKFINIFRKIDNVDFDKNKIIDDFTMMSYPKNVNVSNLVLGGDYLTDMQEDIIINITDILQYINEVILKIRPLVRHYIHMLEYVIDKNGVDFSIYDEEEKVILIRTIRLIKALKSIVNIPILDNDGNLLPDVKTTISSFKRVVDE